jgi:hypothetical protein
MEGNNYQKHNANLRINLIKKKLLFIAFPLLKMPMRKRGKSGCGREVQRGGRGGGKE